VTRARQGGWTGYYDATAGRPPRRTLLTALEGFGGRPGIAVDLGCGDGRDAVELLRRGWRVVAIDAEKPALERLASRADLPQTGELMALAARFEDAEWGSVDLANASFSLPLCPPERFPAVWAKIRRSLLPGGRFAGQLFGERDGWAGRPGLTHLRRDEAERLLDGLAVELFDEEESDGVTPRGARKHWHLFHIVARRA
jgi:SAM-dependent methyltransferase